MPARKPQSLIRRHETAAEREARGERESAVTPGRGLPVAAPAALRGHDVACATWRRVMRTYGEVQGQIVTRLDLDMLVDYCMLTEQLDELDEMRQAALAAWRNLVLHGVLASPVQLEDAYEMVVKLDGRADRKRDLLFKLRQSLYLTPRARAGVAPEKKAEEPEIDPMDALLGEVSEFVNGGTGDEK